METSTHLDLCWPCGALHSSDFRWKPSSNAQALLDLTGELMVDLARAHPSVSQVDVARWLAAVAVGGRSHRGRS